MKHIKRQRIFTGIMVAMTLFLSGGKVMAEKTTDPIGYTPSSLNQNIDGNASTPQKTGNVESQSLKTPFKGATVDSGKNLGEALKTTGNTFDNNLQNKVDATSVTTEKMNNPKSTNNNNANVDKDGNSTKPLSSGSTGAKLNKIMPRHSVFSLKKMIKSFGRIIGSTVILFAVIGIMIGGGFYIFSGGDEGTAERGKGILTASLIGLTVTLLAYLMVTLVQQILYSLS